MNYVEVFNDAISKDTLIKVKQYFNNCEYKFFPESNRIKIQCDDYTLFNDIFSQIKGTCNVELIDIECFMIKENKSDDFGYEKNIKDKGCVFDLQIVRSGRNNILIGNDPQYKNQFVSVILKQIIISYFINHELRVIQNFNDRQLTKIIQFTQDYNFDKTCYDPYYFTLSFLVYINYKFDRNLLYLLSGCLQKIFDIFFIALEQHNRGILYHEKIHDFLCDNPYVEDEYKLHSYLLELTVEKFNSSFGNSYFQYAITNDPFLYNIPLKDNQCIKYPNNLIHRREPYETYTDDNVIHILFKCKCLNTI